jgi:hypothetical protein
VLLLTTQALPQLLAHRTPHIGRLLVPRHLPRLAETLEEGFPVAADNGCFTGYNISEIGHMVRKIAPLPTIAARVQHGWGTFAGTPPPGADLSLPEVHPNFLWLAVPDVLRCACGADELCPADRRGPDCAPLGDADATLERFRDWHIWLCHLPLAFVLQDGSERPGRIPWDAPSLRAVFLGGSTEWKLGPAAASLIAEAKRRGKWVHAGRVNSLKRIHYFKSLGVDSIDGTKWVRWRDRYLDEGLAAVAEPPQLRLSA